MRLEQKGYRGGARGNNDRLRITLDLINIELAGLGDRSNERDDE